MRNRELKMNVAKYLKWIVLIFLICSIEAYADSASITVTGTSSAGNPVSALITLSFNNPAQATPELTVTVKNTSSDGSVITGIGLMGLSSANLSVSGWYLSYGADTTLTPAKQFGTFDVALDTGATGLNSGNPSVGIDAGSTVSFTLTNLGFAGVFDPQSAADFLNLTNLNGLTVALRFQSVGPDGEDSAKVGGAAGGARESSTVPEPGSLLLAGLGFGVCAFLKRLRRQS